MARFADQISQNEQQAAVTQQALRNNRRVVRHRNDGDNDDTQSVVVRESSNLPVTVAPKPIISEIAAVSSSHSAITLSPLDLPAEQFKAGLDRRKANSHVLMEWLRTALPEGVD